MKTKIIFLTTLCIAFTACNWNYDNKKTEDESSDTVEMIDAATSEHLAFKGVPIDGTLKQYVARMKKAGFKYVGAQDGVAILQGDFAGYKGCEVYVSTLEGCDVVSNIVVKFPDEEIWRRLYGNYTDLKEMLTEKYGKPSLVNEKFQDGQYLDDDNDRMHAVSMDRCKYDTHFETEKGEIILWIEHSDFSTTFVCLQYLDKLNRNSIKQQAINDL